jgi:hypothetical protein
LILTFTPFSLFFHCKRPTKLRIAQCQSSLCLLALLATAIKGQKRERCYGRLYKSSHRGSRTSKLRTYETTGSNLRIWHPQRRTRSQKSMRRSTVCSLSQVIPCYRFLLVVFQFYTSLSLTVVLSITAHSLFCPEFYSPSLEEMARCPARNMSSLEIPFAQRHVLSIHNFVFLTSLPLERERQSLMREVNRI